MIWTDPELYYASPADSPYFDQGDLIVAPATVLDGEPEGLTSEPPEVGRPVRRVFWSEEQLGRRTTGETTLGLAMIVSHGCSLDREFNRSVDVLTRGGTGKRRAVELAAADETLDRLLTVAPVIPLKEALPSAPEQLLRNAVIGYFPVCGSEERSIDEGIVDLSRSTTLDRAVILDRLGILAADARATLLYALTRYWAYRAPKLTYELEEAIGKRIVDVNIAKGGDLGVELRLGDGSTLRLLQAPADPGSGPERPALTPTS